MTEEDKRCLVHLNGRAQPLGVGLAVKTCHTQALGHGHKEKPEVSKKDLLSFRSLRSLPVMSRPADTSSSNHLMLL